MGVKHLSVIYDFNLEYNSDKFYKCNKNSYDLQGTSSPLYNNMIFSEYINQFKMHNASCNRNLQYRIFKYKKNIDCILVINKQQKP